MEPQEAAIFKDRSPKGGPHSDGIGSGLAWGKGLDPELPLQGFASQISMGLGLKFFDVPAHLAQH